MEKKKHKRLDDQHEDFETVVDVEDPYAFFEKANEQTQEESEEEFKVP